MTLKNKLVSTVSLAVVAIGIAASAAAETKMGIVVKIGGIPWFNAMEEGIKERAAELGVSAEMIGPTSADPALQVRAIEDLIAKGVDVIGVVPNDEAALEPVLKKAMDAGIKVLAHEGPGLTNVDWNFELASADGFGEAHAELLCEKAEKPGSYAVYVGSLTVPLHNAWADAAIAWMGDNCTDLKLVGDRYGVAESVDDSRSTALDVMAANDDLRGFLAFGSQGPIGAGRAIEERRLGGKVHVMGPFSPGQGRQLLKDDIISGGFMWNPAEAGRVFVSLGQMLVDGAEITDGTEIPGLGVVSPDADSRNIITDNLLSINKTTVDELAEKGL
ncbi:substrate-binding domain-containing protein [Actibacterium sp. 188UL27-1]|uniref:substrate-binding domain-containing protein n=1 Tax=Actibacterium sp. 188UL27-1 TaxID=2786961 RepID=UPI001957C7AD|nr:substrate-binding domain-containing protein [Actibacterium sp. 188UL27-1]MBM7069414.1 substrate-binding domain-containing protein [Actibacterium sp. 188UL27-1]